MTDPTSMNTSAPAWRKQAEELGDRLEGLVILNFTRGSMEACYHQIAGATDHRLEFHGVTTHDQSQGNRTGSPPWLLKAADVAEKLRGKQVLFTNPVTRKSWACIEQLHDMLPGLDARALHMPMPFTLELEKKSTGRRWLNEQFPQLAIATHETPRLGSVAKKNWSEGGIEVNLIRNQLQLKKHLRLTNDSDNQHVYEEMIRSRYQWSIHCLAQEGKICRTSRICIEDRNQIERFIYKHPTMHKFMHRTFNDDCQVPASIDRFIAEFMQMTQWNGFINFEFKCRDNDEEHPVVIEINPRYSDGWDTPDGDFFNITGSDMIETLACYNELARGQ